MLDLKIKVSKTQTELAVTPTKYSRRNQNITAPVNEVKLSYYEEQRLYDRMYEAEVYKNGRFFGYRSTTNQRWHDDEQSNKVAAVMSDEYEKTKYKAVITIAMEEQLVLQEEHADWLHAQDNAAAEREQHKRKTRG